MNLVKEIKLKWVLGPILTLVLGYYFIVLNIQAWKIGWYKTYDNGAYMDTIGGLIPTIDISVLIIFIIPLMVGNWHKKLTNMKFFYMGDDKWLSQNEKNYY